MCNLLAPPAARPGLFALHAFNVETAKIRGTTAEQAIGRMRVAWWRQTLEQAWRGEPPDHPVAQALAHAHVRHGLELRLLEQLLDAREDDLAESQKESRDTLISYCERTAGSLLLLGLECAPKATGVEAAEHAAVHVGCALGLASLLRGTAVHASQSCTFIPVDVAARHNLTLKQVLSGRDSVDLSNAVAELASDAVSHLLAARALSSELPRDARSILLPAVVADHILQQLQRSSYAVFSGEIRKPLGLRLLMALNWNGFRGSY